MKWFAAVAAIALLSGSSSAQEAIAIRGAEAPPNGRGLSAGTPPR